MRGLSSIAHRDRRTRGTERMAASRRLGAQGAGVRYAHHGHGRERRGRARRSRLGQASRGMARRSRLFVAARLQRIQAGSWSPTSSDMAAGDVPGPASGAGSNAAAGTIEIIFAIWRRVTSRRIARCRGDKRATSEGKPPHSASRRAISL